MRGSAAFRTGIAPGGALVGPWASNPLWAAARAVPSLDLRFAESKSLTDAVSGQSLVTFTRASSGTYVGSDGLLKTATTNLQTWSEDFRNTADAGATRPWVYNTSAVTADNTAAPNGTTTADLIAGAAGTANKFLTNNISATVLGFYTFSVYLKQGTEQFVVIRLTDGSANGIRGRFDLAAGTVVITNEGTATSQAASATAVGNGWYRCVVTCSVSSLPSSVMQPQLWLNNFASTSLTTNYFAWGAQLEQSSTVGEYIPTTSTINSAPRFDHNPTTGESLGLLVEEQRTNLHLQSGNLSGYSFTISGAGDALTNFYGTGADGVASRTLRVQTGSTARLLRWVDNGCGIDALSTQYTISFFYRGTLPLSVGARAGTTVGPTVIYAPSGGLMGRAQAVITSGTNAIAFLDFLYTSHSDGELWGIQVEKSVAFPTSYIPTTTATATRSADVASITGANFSSWYSQSEGTVFADVDRNTSITAATTVVSINDNTTNNRLLNFRQDSASQLTVISQTGGSLDASPQVSLISVSPRNKVAAAQALNNLAASANGGTAVVDTVVAMPTVNQMQVGNVTNVSLYSGTIRRLTYWPARLPNSTLQQITQ